MRTPLSRLVPFHMLCLLAVASVAAAQTPQDGRLLVTIVDATQAVIPNATVTITRTDGGGTPAVTRTTDERGQVLLDKLARGRYSVRGEFPGFRPGILTDLNVRSGETRRVLVLALLEIEEAVTVARDRQEVAADRSATFGTALTREQIDALSDDPEELRRQLQDIAGPGATIVVDSFEGRDLPPKSQIKSIRITRDQFAPEVHSAGQVRIEVITQPGIGPLRGGVNVSFYDSAMDGRHPLVSQRGPAQSSGFGGGMGGSLLRERMSFSVNLNGQSSYSTPVQYAATPDGTIARNADVRSPVDMLFASAYVDYALTRDHVLRGGFQKNSHTRRNVGVGTHDLLERAYSIEDRGHSVFLQETGPLGRRFVINNRVFVNSSSSQSRSVVEGPTVIVNDAFTSGGAQRAGGTRNTFVSLATDLDYVRGSHSVRTGVSIEATQFRSDARSNYFGTYTFASLEAYEQALPRSYTQRIGDPNVEYWNVQSAWYIQDDIKVRKGLTVTTGVRYEAQTHVPDRLNLAPRVGVTWAPSASGRTTLRGSWGIFYDWLAAATYSQTIEVDGFRQREVNLIDPSFPDPGTLGDTRAINRYSLADDLPMPWSSRVSAGVSHQVSPRLTIGTVYSLTDRRGLLVGRNLNAPVDGVRPDPGFANVVQATPDGRGRAHSLTTNANLNMGPPGPPGSGPRWSAKRGLVIFSSYTLGYNYDDTDGPFALPPTGNLAEEWGPSNGDRRHRADVMVSSGALRSLNARLGFGRSSPGPLTIRTGLDDNGDLVFNDRPAGVRRNSVRTTDQWNSSAHFTYMIPLGTRQVTTGGGVQVTSSGGGMTVNAMGAQTLPRYRLNLSLGIQNLLNKPFYSGFSGVMTSQFFLRPTSATGVRRVTMMANISF